MQSYCQLVAVLYCPSNKICYSTQSIPYITNIRKTSGVPREGAWGVQTPHLPKIRRPSKIVPNSPRLWKPLKIAEFRRPPHQNVRIKGSKILKRIWIRLTNVLVDVRTNIKQQTWTVGPFQELIFSVCMRVWQRNEMTTSHRRDPPTRLGCLRSRQREVRITFRLTNVIPERIIFVSRGITVHVHIYRSRLCTEQILFKFGREVTWFWSVKGIWVFMSNHISPGLHGIFLIS
jgi:hypothetical protein